VAPGWTSHIAGWRSLEPAVTERASFRPRFRTTIASPMIAARAFPSVSPLAYVPVCAFFGPALGCSDGRCEVDAT